LDNNRPIGIFDSGVGGLTVVKSFLQELPYESFIYFGDTANVPYGDKTLAELKKLAEDIIAFFLSRGVKAIVSACGTTASVVLPLISNNCPVPLLGVVKAGARTAINSSKNHRIGIISTQATANSLAFTREIKAINSSIEVFEIGCPRLVPLIEAGKLTAQETKSAVNYYINPLKEKGIDTLVLGCTHYPFLFPLIKDCVGEKITVIDISYETIAELKNILVAHNLCKDSKEIPQIEFVVSGSDDSFYRVGKILVGDTIKKVRRILLNTSI